ncbi:MAG TPA: 2-C-methyl-D-erythritol 4-phosphate cytidylyltransferase [Bacteroidia bacterium]|nr:2-C-methyl-D-erythritol 4-phosphate cytidylyltransferase [Bacteroidia bacterium]
MRQHVIITAGGSGTRLQSELPKQFLLLNKLPMLMHTMKKFSGISGKIIVTLQENHFETWEKLCSAYQFEIPHEIVSGGESRFHSVKNAMEKITDDDSLIAVHDGVRPAVSEELIQRIFDAAEKNGNAVPFLPLSESIRQVDEKGNAYADRKNFISIQTPQCFSIKSLRRAYAQKFIESFTDDAAAVEAATGEKIFLVEGKKQNVKITTMEDLIFAEQVMSMQQ